MVLDGLPNGGYAYDIAEWLKEQSLPVLKEQRKTDWIARFAVGAIATFSDTLAMREIVLGASKNDLSRDRCARIPGLLAVGARRIYADDKAKTELRAVNEHRNLYENACPS